MIEALVYDAGGTETYDASDLAAARAAQGTTWVRASEADAEEMQRVAEAFGIHHLSVEDVSRDIRPKAEQFPNHTFLLVESASLRSGETRFDEEIRSTQVGLFVGRDWLVTMSTGRVGAVDDRWESVRAGDERVIRFGPDFVAYQIVDRLVDEYYAVLDDIETAIEAVEDGIVEGPEADPETLEEINEVRRDLLSFRKVVWPTREAVGVLARGGPDEVRDATEKYYRDVHDHLVHLVDLTETYRELVHGSRDLYLNALSQSTNEVMRTLTVVATIFIPLTFVVGVYGMNFEGSPLNMPELGWTFGFPAAMLGMAASTLVLVAYFRSEGWL